MSIQQWGEQLTITIRIGHLQYFNYVHEIQSIYLKIKHLQHIISANSQNQGQEQTHHPYRAYTRQLTNRRQSLTYRYNYRTYAKEKESSRWYQDFYLTNSRLEDGLQFILVLNQIEVGSQLILVREYQQTFNTVALDLTLSFSDNQKVLVAIVSLQIGLHQNEDPISGILQPILSLASIRQSPSQMRINKLEVYQAKHSSVCSCIDQPSEFQEFELCPLPFIHKRYPKP